MRVLEKGGYRHEYRISREGLEAIRAYVEKERATDAGKRASPALFLPAETAARGTGRLNVKTINTVWNHVCVLA